jgi:tetratricopeptide (TPR) repeat protein
MGGCGKSQLAFDCCEQFQARELQHLIFWINASSPVTLTQSLTVFAQMFKSSIDAANEVAIAQFFINTIESWTTPWLLVFDNFDDPDCFIHRHLDEYFPRGRQGSMLITSRHLKARNLGHTIDVTDMTETEALELLMTRSQTERSVSNVVEGKKIVARLGRHALAVDQAAAYILRHVSIDRYLNDYEECREKLLDESPAFSKYRRRLQKDPETDTELTVMTTCELSLERISGTPKAKEDKEHILTLVSFLDGTRISTEIFSPYANQHEGWVTSCTGDDSLGDWKESLFLNILKDLRDLSLLQSLIVNKEGAWFSVHPLIQDWAKSRITPEARQRFEIESILILYSFLRENGGRPMPLEQSQLVLTQLEAMRQNDSRHLQEVDLAQDIELLTATSWFATFYEDQGRFMIAEELNQRALRGRRTLLGKEHPDTLTSMNNLAYVMQQQGKYKEAEHMDRQTLELKQKVLGKEHPSTLLSMHNLAAALGVQRRHKEADQMYRQTLELREKVLGSEHPLTLLSLCCLGVNLANCECFPEAEDLFRRSFYGCVKVLSVEHPQTLDSLRELKLVLERQGKHAEAEEVQRDFERDGAASVS